MKWAWIKRLAGWIVTLAAVAFFVFRIASNLHRMPDVRWSAFAVFGAVGSIGMALVAIVLSAVIWQVLLRDQGMLRPWYRIVSIYLFAQFGKYLPGNIGQFVGRVILASRLGIPASTTFATMLTEVLWGVGAALALAALSLRWFLPGHLTFLPAWAGTGSMLLLFALLFVSPWVGARMLRRFAPRLVARVSGGHGIVPPGWFAAILVSGLYVGCFVAMGAMLRWQARYLFLAPDASLLQCSGFFALAWLAGYLLPGAPAGIGVRESIIAILFAPVFGEGTAVALGVTSRLATTLADALAFVMGWCGRHIRVAKLEGLSKP